MMNASSVTATQGILRYVLAYVFSQKKFPANTLKPNSRRCEKNNPINSSLDTTTGVIYVLKYEKQSLDFEIIFTYLKDFVTVKYTSVSTLFS